MTFYHATYKPYLKSILQQGLIPAEEDRRNWSYEGKGVFLTSDKEVALSFAETSEKVPEDWLDLIVLLKIDPSGLDNDRLYIDDNVLAQDISLDGEPCSFIYHGVIEPKYLEVV